MPKIDADMCTYCTMADYLPMIECTDEFRPTVMIDEADGVLIISVDVLGRMFEASYRITVCPMCGRGFGGYNHDKN